MPFVPTETKADMKVSNLYISQVKRKCGIEVGKNYNLPYEKIGKNEPVCIADENKTQKI